MERDDLARLRREYSDIGLDIADLDPDPLAQFRRWLDDVLAADYFEPNAVVLTTTGLDGWPSARNVLLKGLDERGFVFYTNYTSDKARDLDQTGKATLLFSWTEVRRQVRVSGMAKRLPAEESDAYFASRPRGSQLGAWASDQSSTINDRAGLDRQFTETAGRFNGVDIPRPPFWGGYRVEPFLYEFWQGREYRLHDRLRYNREDDRWRIERLQP
jgi:pyridoxamine 5'-phosphate oxidase